MGNEAGMPPVADVQFFKKLSQDIRAHPNFYREAGRWLDRNYSDGALRRREKDQIPEWARKKKTGRTPEARELIAELRGMRRAGSKRLDLDKALRWAVKKARRDTGVTGRRLARLQARKRSGHLAGNLRSVTKAEKTQFARMTESEKQELRKRLVLIEAIKKKGDGDLCRFRPERDRLCRLVRRYWVGDLRDSELNALASRRFERRRHPRGAKRGFLMLLRFTEATLQYRQFPPAFPTASEAKRVVLMTWLMTDTTAHEAKLGLTGFERWPWDCRGDRGHIESRRYASDWWRFPSEAYSDWVGLAKRAWQALEGLPRGEGKRGRPVQTNPKEDEKLASHWGAARARGTTLKEFARLEGLKYHDLKRALDRHRKRTS